jgi:uncharacterized protein DUF5619
MTRTDSPYCPMPSKPDLSGVTVIELHPEPPLRNHAAALALAQREATARFLEPMLLAWYDRDRDFESPQHASECHEASAVPGYVDYALSHGATLKLDVEDGRFVFFYLCGEL